MHLVNFQVLLRFWIEISIGFVFLKHLSEGMDKLQD